MLNLVIGCDPNAMHLKKELIDFLHNSGYKLTDFGSDDPIYANTAIKVAEAVVNHEFDRGILICGTGIGMSISANKVKGAHAALISDCYSAERASKSNNANVACLGAFTIGSSLAKKLVAIWLESEFDPNSPSNAKVGRIIQYESKK